MISNTKISFFRSYATGVQPFRNIVQTTKTPNAFSVMNKMDQNDTCSLHYAADMIKDLTAGLLKMKQVSPFWGEVMSANFEDNVRFLAMTLLKTYLLTHYVIYRNQNGQYGYIQQIYRATSKSQLLA